VGEKYENSMAKRTPSSAQQHERMIEIEDHSRTIPGAEAPLNSIGRGVGGGFGAAKTRFDGREERAAYAAPVAWLPDLRPTWRV
jgi:hypothetical protein